VKRVFYKTQKAGRYKKAANYLPWKYGEPLLKLKAQQIGKIRDQIQIKRAG